MILISHRGNTSGINKQFENNPKYIEKAIDLGFDVEVDIWFKDGDFFLGHDLAETKVNTNYLENDKLWCHAKNIEALLSLSELNCKYFWHQKDDVTITSNGYFWTYPGKKLTRNSICVLPEISKIKEINCAGICSDYIEEYKFLND